MKKPANHTLYIAGTTIIVFLARSDNNWVRIISSVIGISVLVTSFICLVKESRITPVRRKVLLTAQAAGILFAIATAVTGGVWLNAGVALSACVVACCDLASVV